MKNIEKKLITFCN